ncbi:MAG: serine/threonine protein kinase [Anaerolineales bacterium]|nr:serine/threonine protein kinase [Anaerolineales bacterium]
MENIIGKQLGPYQVIEPLGEGGMAAVYKGYQPGVDRYVALKVLPKRLAEDPEFIGRFQQEAKILAQLQHPHILPVFDYGESEGYTYIVMPFIQGGTLADLLHGYSIPLAQTTTIISQIADALDYAHNKGLIHRDIKPSNVLIDESGNCLLTDFGIAKLFSSTSKFTSTGGIIGTPNYMSPEQGQGHKTDKRSDVYSLGVMLYELVTGRVPYTAETPIATVIKHMLDPLPAPRQINSAIPESVEQVILRALAKDPVNRFPTAGDLATALQAATGTVGITPTQIEVPFVAATVVSGETTEKNNTFRSKWLLPLGIIIALSLVFCGGSTYFVYTKMFKPLTEATDNVPVPLEQSSELATKLDSVTPATEISSAVSIIVETATNQPVFTNTPSSTNSPEPTATFVPTNTAVPSSTFIPTATDISPTLTPSCPPVTGVFANTGNQLQNKIGCATGAVINGLVVEENFQSGKMFWREPLDYAQALVLFNNGTWRIFQHAPYNEGDPEYPCADANTPAQSPPTPRRGFGTMWCDIPAIRNGLGNAVDVEQGYTSSMQKFDNGSMLLTNNGTTYIFFANGAWESR